MIDRAALVEMVGRALAFDAYEQANVRLDDPYTADAEYWNRQANIAIDLIRAETLEEAARTVPTTWLDPLLNGPGATKLPLDVPGVEKLCQGIAASIRALKETPCSFS